MPECTMTLEDSRDPLGRRHRDGIQGGGCVVPRIDRERGRNARLRVKIVAATEAWADRGD